ncbi:methionyl-tRNA formyltransferase [Aliikangiella sp. G2MR2-5]|uniref:methionyl-tRNA formyltransferase n=1 Tax=Aliikangiella sp. G2MR2-5 TaxID=2788943 RepID=UPI0018AAC348|nr:methionyl-tRNA formyltransferase [Aliikangiella sp. G2MR2-5]
MTKKNLKIIFAGTPDFAAAALQAIIDAGHQVCAVYCQPDRPSGRGKKLIAGPVKNLALEHNIPVEQPQNFKSESDLAKLASYQADLMVVVAYGLLLPKAVLNIPRYGCVNIHGSLLPRWRGAAPIQRAIEAGDSQSGITIMQMDEGLDTGNMLLKVPCGIEVSETGSSLHDKLATLGGLAITHYLAEFDPQASGEKQDDALANYASKLSKQEASIDWNQPALAIERKVRAFNAWPVCYTAVDGNRIRVWEVEVSNEKASERPGTVTGYSKKGIEVVCGDQTVILLTKIQPDGGKAMDAAALLNSKSQWFEGKPVLTSA